MYRIHVHPIDPVNPEKPFFVSEFDTLAEATENAREWANNSGVAFADVFTPDGEHVAQYTVTGFELVDLLNPPRRSRARA